MEKSCYKFLRICGIFGFLGFLGLFCVLAFFYLSGG